MKVLVLPNQKAESLHSKPESSKEIANKSPSHADSDHIYVNALPIWKNGSQHINSSVHQRVKQDFNLKFYGEVIGNFLV